jgi:hypothetical protein
MTVNLLTSPLQTVGLTAVGNGIGLVAGDAGSSINRVLCVKSLIAGPGIKISASDSFVDVTISATHMPAVSSLITATVHWLGSNTSMNHVIFTAAFPMTVTAIMGRVEGASSTAGTILVVKAASGVATASGVMLMTSGFDVTSTAYTVRTMTLASDISALTLQAGDTIGIQTTGTWTSAAGGLTIYMAPV